MEKKITFVTGNWAKVATTKKALEPLGYEIDNVVPCCSVCNRGKGTMKFEDWISYLNQLCSFRKNR